MKAKKALKRLRRVEELLSIVIDEFAGNEPAVRELLDSAKTSVIRAKAGINSPSAPGKAKKPQGKAATKPSKRSDLTASGKRGIFLAVKERASLPKRSSEPKSGSTVKPAGERGTGSRAFPTPPITKPADTLAPEASPEPHPDAHAN